MFGSDVTLVRAEQPRFNATFDMLADINGGDTIALVLILGVLLFAVLTSIMLVRTRQRASAADTAARDEIMALNAERDRFQALLMSEPQILVSWAAADNEPDITGDTTLFTTGSVPQRVLAFGSWLEADKAQAMEHAVDALRADGEAFSMQLMTNAGRAVEADGRAVGGRAVLRLRDASGLKRELAELNARHERLSGEMESLRALIDALPSPVWARDVAGALTFVNPAYARAVEARDPAEVIARSMELLTRFARDEARRARGAGANYVARTPAIVAGSRRSFDVLDVPTRKGSAGIGIDATEAEMMRSELNRINDAHRRTLDQLATGVAIFTADQRLTFYNAAYRSLWELDTGFLDQNPTDSAVLDRLRASRKLPEEKDFREWKAALHEAYRATDADEHLWHLPDSRTMRVVTTPNPQGGVTYLFEDVTERLDMVRRYDAMIRVQGETLDNLAEAVAVFGSDGRLRLHNPAFADMWRLQPLALAERPHIEAVIGWCKDLYDDDSLWRALHGTVTAIEGREVVKSRLELRNGSVADLITVPLPDGATLVAFLDVTDTINVERALRERNEALETADALKVDFVHHVSYELRSPLTNIIGFASLMGEPSIGPLSGKQREYLGYINTSTNALLAIINDIIDLATIDAGAMKLNLGEVDVRQTMHAAAEGIRDRLIKDNITLDIRAADDIGSFAADERRIRQVLFNLLANAVGFSPPGATITLAAERRPDAVVFAVTDTGPGIPPEVQGRVFDWFESHSQGSRHRGAGLGLSIVRSFVELHGGTVTLDSAVGQGTRVECSFPVEHHAEPERKVA
ncbi:MAG: PAS-domain containing protein [Alphaproteobacteria bacterium]|nr:PAS-domain containing protein [Alphaproteobacteria bacterium]